MSPTGALMVAGAEVKAAGTPISDDLFGRLREIRVEHTLMLPSSFTLTFADPELVDVDGTQFRIGAPVEIGLAAAAASALTPVLKGEVVAVEPEFTERGALLVVRGYDASHRLHRVRRSQTFQKMSVAEIARKVIGQAGLRTGTIEAAGGSMEFVQQSAETDWQFLWRLARLVGLEVVPEDDRLHMRRPRAEGPEPTLTWGEALISFRPRLTGMQQVATARVDGFDPLSGRALTATGRPERTSTPSEGAGTWTGTESASSGTPTTDAEAKAQAAAIAARLGEAHVEAEGTCFGAPALRAGTRVRIDGVGRRFGGAYRLSDVTHVFRTTGYETRFRISGAATHGLVDLVAPPAPPDFGATLAVGIVTNNTDPESIGRVRVKYPGLGGDVEGAWARVAVPQAGRDRGQLMLPLPDDEVVLGFEGGDPRRPYVLGAVWNGKQKPGPLSKPDGSYSLVSPKAYAATANEGTMELKTLKGDLMLTSDGGSKIVQKASADLTLDGQNITAKAVSRLTAEAASASVKASGPLGVEGSAVTVKGSGSVTVEANGSMTVKGAGITIQATGSVRISAPQIQLG